MLDLGRQVLVGPAIPARTEGVWVRRELDAEPELLLGESTDGRSEKLRLERPLQCPAQPGLKDGLILGQCVAQEYGIHVQVLMGRPKSPI
jgi:hypothetical protein